jgi:membrane-associated protease RseP (regulator of RpoE activity)
MDLMFYDLALLVLFIIFSSFFLYRNKKNLKQEGWLLLYKTKWGVRLIDKIGIKYKRTLKFLSYVSIFLGYILMVAIVYLIIQTIYLYFTTEIARVISAPPIAPLIPYFPQLFGLESFFPPFYFIYFIVAILIIATVHEFSHGIFARRYDIKIKSTGFAFLKWFPAIFGAFVEQDDKDMDKKTKFEQMSVLSAGVFANVVIAVLFFVILCLFFSYAFTPTGIVFDGFIYDSIGIATITSMNGISLDNPNFERILELSDSDKLNKIEADGEKYVITSEILEQQKNSEEVLLYYDSPAINANLNAVITEINGVEVLSLEKFSEEIGKYSPGEKIMISTLGMEGEIEQEIVLGENPGNSGEAWVGIGFAQKVKKGVVGKIYNYFTYKEEHVYYKPNFGEASIFIKDLLWWIFFLNVLVALMNMLPLGILDGGRFFYLTVLGITKSDNFAKKTFAFITWFLLFSLLAVMIKWAWVRFF